MSDPDTLHTLNTLLNRLDHSLLQYIGESWPWTDPEHAARQETVLRLAQKQRLAVERLAEFLTDRRAVIAVDNYPFDASEFHYCTVDYVKPRIIADEERLVAELKQAVSVVNSDHEAARLMQQLAAEEEQTLAAIKAL